MTTPADIVLVTANARYHHASLGLRCLLANLGPLRSRAVMHEYPLDAPLARMAAEVLEHQPRVIGLGIYIWNVAPMRALAQELRAQRPDAVLVMGGPELFYETETHPLTPLADYVISGEGEIVFRNLCEALLRGERPPELRRTAPRLDLATLLRPDEEYTEADDLAHRVVYVETSRGCPFGCTYCLSARDRAVRQYPLDATLAGIDRLLARGARTLKFVDRTFNLDIPRAVAILDFLRPRASAGRAFQFEMVPERFPPELRHAVRGFPPGCLRLEIGIQSFDPAVNARVGRRMDPDVVEDTLAFLCREAGVTVHADLIAGLPGETLDGLGAGFDRLLAAGPREIQLGLLKRLRGAPLASGADTWSMHFGAEPPYELRDSRHLPAADIARVQAFAYFWERVYNRRRLAGTLPLFWEGAPSPFHAFMSWVDWVVAREGRAHSITLDRLVEHAFTYLTAPTGRGLDAQRVAAALQADYAAPGRTQPPLLLRPHLK